MAIPPSEQGLSDVCPRPRGRPCTHISASYRGLFPALWGARVRVPRADVNVAGHSLAASASEAGRTVAKLAFEFCLLVPTAKPREGFIFFHLISSHLFSFLRSCVAYNKSHTGFHAYLALSLSNPHGLELSTACSHRSQRCLGPWGRGTQGKAPEMTTWWLRPGWWGGQLGKRPFSCLTPVALTAVATWAIQRQS